ncbi:MAG: hypothetical protein ACE5Q3_17385 [Alphaproteobacteria bacterium]
MEQHLELSPGRRLRRSYRSIPLHRRQHIDSPPNAANFATLDDIYGANLGVLT